MKINPLCSRSRALATLMAGLLAGATASDARALELLTQNVSFNTAGQSIWSEGDAFDFSYAQFFGATSPRKTNVYNPNAVSGKVEIKVLPDFDWYVNPYFSLTTELTAGIEVGANIHGGSIDANLDYAIAISAPGPIVRGEYFQLEAVASTRGSSAFATRPANASAWVDGILDAYAQSFIRFETARDLGDHDYRLTTTLANVDVRKEIVSFNRDDSGRLRIIGAGDVGGVGSVYTLPAAALNGSTSVTAGDWRVSANGALGTDTLTGAGQTTLLTADIDVDQFLLSGSDVLGTRLRRDFGVIDIDFGYEVVDLDAALTVGLQQSFEVSGDVLMQLSFSEAVRLENIGEMTQWIGRIDELPAIAVLGDDVTVDARFLVDATLSNRTGITFGASLDLTLLELFARASYDVSYFGSDRRGQFLNARYGPVYQWSSASNALEIPVFDNAFALGGFQSVDGGSFVLSAVPEPRTAGLLCAGLLVLGLAVRRQRI
ncbi:PEP-CTERM sorting domain-containing protein [Methyloversatilis sp. XJ19-49]|uniref:PEP-CTERM sorting domain-containing protein n=1 Tax=Methyloversatilis sp. XJ19-49 TaxID=2963429 RepID=UPI00211C4D5B|nr:PEP-CTERM sorting domain-containing protein [Methyloversatilis sp. XJ19-49]MCQ9378336.1 PEP-CTERM sorting domain-containing protein [Methyloversatilis sp. XJ19-49]